MGESIDDLSSRGAVPATSLRRALAILGDPWTMLILKEAFNGVRRFGAFQRALNIPKQTLSLRLAHLCREQMLYKRQIGPRHSTLEYVPTAKTFDLQDVMYSIWLWHEANPGDVEVLPFDLVHLSCGRKLGAVYRCTGCREPVTPETLEFQRSLPGQVDELPGRHARRNDGAVTATVDHRSAGLVAATLVGDAACNEILYLLARGPRHMQAIADELGLSLPVVRGRLDLLKDLGLASETPEGRRLVYAMLPPARDFMPLLLSLAAWGDRWSNGGEAPPELAVHTCGALLRAHFACSHCGEWIGRDTIRVRPRQGTKPVQDAVAEIEA